MRKQSGLFDAGRRLRLNKKTISNLTNAEMDEKIGASYYGPRCGWPTKKCTQNQNTCPGHKTCYNC